MSRFPTPGQLCAWAGVAPASYESAGKRRPAGTRHGAQWLRTAAHRGRPGRGTHQGQLLLGPVLRASPDGEARTRPPSRSRTRCCSPSGTCSRNGALYDDPGADYFERRHDPAVEAKRLARRIEALGFDVSLIEKVA